VHPCSIVIVQQHILFSISVSWYTWTEFTLQLFPFLIVFRYILYFLLLAFLLTLMSFPKVIKICGRSSSELGIFFILDFKLFYLKVFLEEFFFFLKRRNPSLFINRYIRALKRALKVFYLNTHRYHIEYFRLRMQKISCVLTHHMDQISKNEYWAWQPPFPTCWYLNLLRFFVFFLCLG
jgi:hypothetical protein